jgi:hypothetical protein
MILSLSRNFIFIHIDKAGGTSIEEALTPYLNWNDFVFGGTGFGHSLENLYAEHFGWDYLRTKGLWKHSTAKDIKLRLGDKWNSMYKFATVRNPEDLLTSLYFYKKKTLANGDTNDEAYQYLPLGLNGFIQKVIEIEYEAATPQIKRFDYDSSVELFNIDTIDNHWQYILNKLHIKDKVHLPVLNKVIKDEPLDLTNETKNLIKDCFQDDYKMLESL